MKLGGRQQTHMRFASESVSRVVEAYQSRIVAASGLTSSIGPPLSQEQQAFVRDVLADASAIMRREGVEGKIRPPTLETKTQTPGKVWARDGFGHKSILTGVPHANVQFWGPAARHSFEVLISQDGKVALVADKAWGSIKGSKSVPPGSVGKLLGGEVVHAARLDSKVSISDKAREDRLRPEEGRADVHKKDEALARERAQQKEQGLASEKRAKAEATLQAILKKSAKALQTVFNLSHKKWGMEVSFSPPTLQVV